MSSFYTRTVHLRGGGSVSWTVNVDVLQIADQRTANLLQGLSNVAASYEAITATAVQSKALPQEPNQGAQGGQES